ncbi:MAG: 30S ribosomal protein S20 [Anaerolineales bacterium]|nr:30S ribosomal protein S20 [Anaerolineales bacterium]
MANTASAKKRIRQTVKRQARNQAVRSRYRGFIKNARIGLASGDASSAAEAVHVAVSELDRAASKGIIHRKNASRKKSRLMKQLAALENTK